MLASSVPPKKKKSYIDYIMRFPASYWSTRDIIGSYCRFSRGKQTKRAKPKPVKVAPTVQRSVPHSERLQAELRAIDLRVAAIDRRNAERATILPPKKI